MLGEGLQKLQRFRSLLLRYYWSEKIEAPIRLELFPESRVFFGLPSRPLPLVIKYVKVGGCGEKIEER